MFAVPPSGVVVFLPTTRFTGRSWRGEEAEVAWGLARIVTIFFSWVKALLVKLSLLFLNSYDIRFSDKLINGKKGELLPLEVIPLFSGCWGGSWTFLCFPLVPVLFWPLPSRPFLSLFSSIRRRLASFRRQHAGILFRQVLWWRNLASGESGWRSAAAERSVNKRRSRFASVALIVIVRAGIGSICKLFKV